MIKINFNKYIIFILNYFILINISAKALATLNYSQINNEFSSLKNNISLKELTNYFNISQILEDKYRETYQNFGEYNESKVVSTYSDNFVRFKIFPLAAAAYGTDKNIIFCLTQIYPDFQFIKNWVVKCQFTDPYCSAFIAVSFTDAAIVLAFRGTDTFRQLQHEISDTLFRKKVPSVFGYGHVSSYFYDVFNQLDKKGVTEEIFHLLRKYPTYELWVCIILNFKRS